MNRIWSEAKGPKSVTAVASIIVAVILGLTATAWACTAVMGSIKICSTVNIGSCTNTDLSGQTSTGSGPAGSVIKVTGAGLKGGASTSPAKYSLYFAAAGSGLNCHTSTKILSSPAGVQLTKMTTNTSGQLDKDLTVAGIQPYKAVLPAGAREGEASICAREKYPTPENTASAHATFTIVGGAG